MQTYLVSVFAIRSDKIWRFFRKEDFEQLLRLYRYGNCVVPDMGVRWSSLFFSGYAKYLSQDKRNQPHTFFIYLLLLQGLGEKTMPEMELQSYDYQSPEFEILEMQSEGLLCGSNEIVDEYEGIW